MYSAIITGKYVKAGGQRVPNITRQHTFMSIALDVVPKDENGNELDAAKPGLELGFLVTFRDTELETVQTLFTLSDLQHTPDQVE